MVQTMPQSNSTIGLPMVPDSTANNVNVGNKDIPRDARVITLILASLGVSDAEPAVVAMLLEFAHRYTYDILQGAQAYAEHAQRPASTTAASGSSGQLELDDLRLAVSSKLEHSFSTALPKEFLLPLAARINAIPLPILPESYGIRLPPERERLTAVNWDFLPVRERRTYDTEPNAGHGDEEVSNSMAAAATAANGTDMSGMDIDLSGRDFLGNSRSANNEDEDEEEEDDDDDDEDMEEIAPQIISNDSNGRADSADASAAEEDDADAENG